MLEALFMMGDDTAEGIFERQFRLESRVEERLMWLLSPKINYFPTEYPVS